MTGAEPVLDRLDVRLVPTALSAWAAVLLGLLAGWEWATALAVLALLLALATLRLSRRVWTLGVFACLVVVAGFSTATALRVHAVQIHPLAEAGQAGQAGVGMQLRVRIVDDPKLLKGSIPGAPRQALVRADAIAAQGYQSLGGAVVLMVPAQGWLGLLPGQQVELFGVLAAPKRPDLTVAMVRGSGTPTLLGEPSWFQRAAGSLRVRLHEASARVLPEEPGALLPGLIVGDTSTVSPEMVADFRTAGLTHLTAVSGTNITIVCGAVLLLARFLGAGPRTSAALAGVALVGFVILARPSPSVLRAAVMGSIALLALVTGRRRQAVPALSAAVVVLLVWSPQLAVDAGFALSVLATAGLVLLATGWAAALRKRGVPAGFAELLAVPVAAHVVTAPVIAGLSAQLSLVAVLANLLAAPAVGVATILGVLATLILPVWTPAGELVLRAAEPMVWWLVTVAHRCAALPSAAVTVPGGVAGAVGMAVVTVVVLVLARSTVLRALALAVVLGAGVVWVPTRILTPGWPATGWAMVACDVGQGDAAVLSTGSSAAVVVDTGPDPRAVAGCLDRLGVREVPLVVLTHLHADHVDGLEGVLAGRRVGAVALGPLHLPQDTLARVRAVAVRHGVPLVQLEPGQSLQWPALRLDVLAPFGALPAELTGDVGTELNDYSVVMAAQTTVGRVLLTGDIELAAQAQLLESGLDLHSEVLKMPHHGSRFSAPEFLDAVHPRVALVSVGAGNTYGHPNAGILHHLTDEGVTVVRTDQRGDLAVVPGPDGLQLVARGGTSPTR